MTISLANAIKNVKEDEHWIKKVIIGSVFTLLVFVASYYMENKGAAAAVRILGTCLYLVMGAFLSGFLVSTGNKMLNGDFNKMTEWSEPNLILKGLKFIFSYIVFCVALMLLGALISILISLIVCIILGVIYFAIIKLLNIDPNLLNTGCFIVLFALGTVFIVYLIQFFNAAIISYYKKLSFKDLMSLKKHFRIIKENQHAAWTLIGKDILFILLFMFTALVCCITLFGVVLLPVISFVSYIVSVNLLVQYGREIELGRYME